MESAVKWLKYCRYGIEPYPINDGMGGGGMGREMEVKHFDSRLFTVIFNRYKLLTTALPD